MRYLKLFLENFSENDYGIFYLKTVFPKGHKLEWLNYLHLDNNIPEDLLDEIIIIADDINSKDGIIIPLDNSIHPGCVTTPEIVEEIVNNVYQKFCDIFQGLTKDKDCIRLVWGIGKIDNVNHETTHNLYSYPIVIEVGHLLDSSSEPGIFKV